MPSFDLTQIFGSLIPLKLYRRNFNILTYEPEYSICVKVLKQKLLQLPFSQITVINLTRQDGDDVEAMLLRLYAEDWDNNNSSSQYSKCKLSI